MNYGEDDCASVIGSFGTFVEQLGYVVRTNEKYGLQSTRCLSFFCSMHFLMPRSLSMREEMIGVRR